MKRAILALSLLWLTAMAQEPRVPRQADDIGIQIGPEKYLWLSQYRGKTCVMAFILTTCTASLRPEF